MRSPRQRIRLLRQDGQITWVGAVLLLALAGGAYAAVVFVPVYLLHYEGLQVVRDYGNRAVRDQDDGQLGGDDQARLAVRAAGAAELPNDLVDLVVGVGVEQHDEVALAEQTQN